jgi:hypothetical protein
MAARFTVAVPFKNHPLSVCRGQVPKHQANQGQKSTFPAEFSVWAGDGRRDSPSHLLGGKVERLGKSVEDELGRAHIAISGQTKRSSAGWQSLARPLLF